MVGSANDAMALCERALEQGVFAQAIRPPTVPHGTSRLRMTAMATHKVGELRQAAKVIGEAARELDLTATESGTLLPPIAGKSVPETADRASGALPRAA